MRPILAPSFPMIADGESIWDASYKRSRFWLLFPSLLIIQFLSSKSSFFSLVVSCACIWQLVTAFILLPSFCLPWCVLRPLSFALHNFSRPIFAIPRLFPMGKKRTVSAFFDDAETNGLVPLDKANVNSDKVLKNLKSGTEINYDRMLHLWHEWVFVHGFAGLVKSWKYSLRIYFGGIDMREEMLALALVIWEQQSISWKISCVAVPPDGKECQCILCFRNGRISVPVESSNLARSPLKYQSLFISYEFLSSQSIHISPCVYPDDYVSTFTQSYGKNSNSLPSDVSVIFWQWTILSL